ncbi:hypothetical protein RND71_020447 [Anisodus tanguticus]|uniref:Uncharacterized protein n=1 Tax=Anisodus tanguticus TaxID=243964 RepID=A0AAE1VIG0_9SOLA|nr:hypothetical protein RND71_020447 [Anisodus tanguticus]
MAEFFLIGGGGREETSIQEHHHQETTSTHNWFLYKNHDQELPTYKGFELWQQQQQTQPPDHGEEQNYQIIRNPIINPFGFDIGPSHDHHHHGPNSRSAAKFMMMRSSINSASGGISCQDCGNQAKKDCQHMRCRTCCNSRGFQCSTHVKSTWVPAAKRRERQQQLASLHQQEDNNPKRQKDDPISGSSLVCTRNNTGKVPSNLIPPLLLLLPIVLSCRGGARKSITNSDKGTDQENLRMSHLNVMNSIEDSEDQIAYQAAVNIGGHIFKGILYDQGDHEYNYLNAAGDSSFGGDPAPHQHNLIGAAGIAVSAVENAAGCKWWMDIFSIKSIYRIEE